MTSEHTDAEQLFRPIEPALVAFAERFRLHVDRFPKGSTNWDFAFRHPRGGVGLLQLIGSSSAALLIIGHWTFDDREAGIRYIRSTEQAGMLRDDPDLMQMLEVQLREMVQWRPGQWTQTIPGFKDLWDVHPRAALGYAHLALPSL
jgi:hypothetical protein